MWLDALGLKMFQWVNEELDVSWGNTGIWAPDAGPCDAKKKRKLCKLPFGSKMYSYANREKVMPSFC